MPRIFISYRRQDSSNMTGRIHDSLVRKFGDRSVFRDVYDIPAGSDFRTILNNEVSKGDIFLAIIGPQWVEITDSQGIRRLDDPNDFVRIEVESALNNPQTRVIPVLVNDANMPVEKDLPESLKELCYRNAVKVRTDPDFPHDMEMLLRQLNPSKFSLLMQKRWPILALGMILIVGIFFFPLISGLFNETSSNNIETSSTTVQPTDKPTPIEDTLAPTPLVEPVEPGQIMVLVAQIEQIGSQERDVTRFIVDDLKQRLEVELPFTNVNIREYNGIITSDIEALQIAEQTQAEVVIWGHYEDDNVIANVQLGSLEARSDVVLERDILERTVNVRVKIMDERQETLANQVLSSLTAIYSAENESLKMVLLFMALDILDAPNPEMIGISNATHVHNAMKVYLSDEQLAIDELDRAIELDAGNPILYVFRGLLQQRMGNFDLGEQDSDTALLIAPEDWILPYELKGMGNLVEMNPVDGIKNYTKVIEKRPDWFSYNMRGYFYFVAKEYELARIDIEKSIELGPEAEYPYMWATLIALRQGRMEDVSELQTSLLSEQPDPAFVERFMTALYGEKHAIFLGNSMAAMGHLSLGQYNIVIQNTDNVLSVVPAYPEMYLVKGLSYCNLNNFATAEAAYSQGLAIDPSFTVLYLLRAEVRSKLGDMVGAGEDLVVVQQSDLAENLNSYLVAAESGEFSCKQLITTK
jgi:tetratricopeptide (TPR) repeat protein